MKALTQAQVETYRYDGFLFPVPALTAAEIATCLAGLERLETELGSPVAEAAPAAKSSNTSLTRTRMPRMQGRPPHWAGS
jgi:hypothetical protein